MSDDKKERDKKIYEIITNPKFIEKLTKISCAIIDDKKLTKKQKIAKLAGESKELMKECETTHGWTEENTHGWTEQTSRCQYAGWNDCSFFCNLLSQTRKGKLRKGGLRPCVMLIPDWNKCKQKKVKK